MKLEFYRQIFEKYQTSDFMKIRSFVGELLHLDRRTDRQTDMPKLSEAFRNFANVPKKLDYFFGC